MKMNSTTGEQKRFSLWNLICSEPLYVIIPNVFFIRPIRHLVNCYLKPAKFLVIILPRNIWQKGNVSIEQLFPSWSIETYVTHLVSQLTYDVCHV